MDYSRFPQVYKKFFTLIQSVTSSNRLEELRFSVSDSDQILLLTEQEAVDAVLFCILPQPDFYAETNDFIFNSSSLLPPFGYDLTEEKDQQNGDFDDDEICELLDGCFSQFESKSSFSVLEFLSIVLLARQNLRAFPNNPQKQLLICKAERLLFKLCLEKQISTFCSKFFHEKNLLKFSQVLSFARDFNIFSETALRLHEGQLRRLEGEISIVNEEFRTDHRVGYANVISELSSKLFGSTQSACELRVKGSLNIVRKEIEALVDEFKRCESRLILISRTSETNEKSLKEIEKIEKQLEVLNVAKLREEKQELLKERTDKIKQIAKFKTKLNEAEKEKEEVKKKTLQFAAKFMKEEYGAKLDKAMKRQEEHFKVEVEKIESKHSSEKEELTHEINSLREERDELVSKDEASQAEILRLKKEVDKFTRKLKSEEKLRQLLGAETSGSVDSQTENLPEQYNSLNTPSRKRHLLWKSSKK